MKNILICCALAGCSMVVGCQTRSPRSEASVNVERRPGYATGAAVDTHSVTVEHRPEVTANGSVETRRTIGGSAATDVKAPAPNNTAQNARDREIGALNAADQGTSPSDREITRKVRQAITQNKDLSFTAKNIKVITINGQVTLRGPVKTQQERDAIAAAAQQVSGVTSVENQLEPGAK